MWWHLTSLASWLFTQLFIQGADQRKHQSSASLAFVRRIYRWAMNSLHKGPVTWKIFPFDDVIMNWPLPVMVRQQDNTGGLKSLREVSGRLGAFQGHTYITGSNPGDSVHSAIDLRVSNWFSCVINHYYTPRFNEVERGVYWFHLVRLSVCGQNRVRSVSSTIVIGSILYLHIISSNFRRCVACKVCFKI